MCIRDRSHLEREIIANVVRYNIRDFEYGKVRLEGTYQEGIMELDERGMTIPVSYTHLDVYKRQEYHSRGLYMRFKEQSSRLLSPLL